MKNHCFSSFNVSQRMIYGRMALSTMHIHTHTHIQAQPFIASFEKKKTSNIVLTGHYGGY